MNTARAVPVVDGVAVMGYDATPMRQYRPTIEELKKRYSADMARRKMQERRDARRDPNEKRLPIPDNSEPWLPHKPRSLAECMWISEQVSHRTEQWKQDFLPTSLSRT